MYFTENNSSQSKETNRFNSTSLGGHSNRNDLPYPLEPLGIESISPDGTRIRLGRWKVAVIAVVDKPNGLRSYVASPNIHSGLNPNEAGASFINKVVGLTHPWQLVHNNAHVYVWPKMVAAALHNKPDFVVRQPLGSNPKNLSNPFSEYDLVNMENMKHAGGKRTIFGVPRNAKGFWVKWLEMEKYRTVKTLSPYNLNQIAKGRSPILDETFVRAYPQYREILNNVTDPILLRMEHHHIEHGKWAIPMPNILHRNVMKLYHYTGALRKQLEENFKAGRNPWPTVRFSNGKTYTVKLGRSTFARNIKAYQDWIRTGLQQQDYKTRVQMNRLVRSYNSCNPGKPMRFAGRSGGQIGGVGNEVGLIEGLLDNFDGLNEAEHIFYFKVKDGDMPFGNRELNQIMRELSRGIYVYDTVPFFSLHFNGDSNMYPVIHPAYQDTKVGEVISLLDYYMKGFLNGGYFKKQFVMDWAKTKTQDPKELMKHLVDVGETCERELRDNSYLSIREIIKILEKEDGPDVHGGEFSDYSKFRSSFRIIAKQNEIKKSENAFILDGDFDVLYTIDPDPEYVDALERYRQVHGENPKAYQRLEAAYQQMARQVKELMPKLPEYRDFFNKLEVINFFCYYFNTLKKAGKVPVLKQLPEQAVSTPTLFPHLPIRKIVDLELKLEWKGIVNYFKKERRTQLDKFLESDPVEVSEVPEPLVRILATYIRNRLVCSVKYQLSAHRRDITSYYDNARRMLSGARSKVLPGRIDVRQQIKDSLYRARVDLIDHVIRELNEVKNDRDRVPTIRKLEENKRKLLANKSHYESELKNAPSILAQYQSNLAKATQQKRIETGNLTKYRRDPYMMKLIRQDLAKWNALIPQLNEAISGLNQFIATARAEIAAIPGKIRLIDAEVKRLKGLPGVINRILAQVNLALKATKEKKSIIPSIIPANKSGIDKPLIDLLNQWNKGLKDFEAHVKKQLDDINNKKASDLVLSILISETLKCKDTVLQLYQDQSSGEAHETKRIVGGCGMTLASKSISIAPGATTLLDTMFVDLYKGTSEEFVAVKPSGAAQAEGYAFRMGNTDFAVSDNDEHMTWATVGAASEKEEAELADVAEVLEAMLIDAEDFDAVATRNKAHLKKPNGVVLMQHAAMSEDPEFIKKLIALGGDVESIDPAGYSLLHYAVKKGQDKVLKELCRMNASLVNMASVDGTTPLHMAILKNKISCVEDLIRLRANVNARTSYGMNPLYLAIHHGHKDIALRLLQVSGVDVMMSIEDGTTPLHLAIESHLDEVVIELIRKGASLDAVRLDSFTPMHLAAKYSRLYAPKIFDWSMSPEDCHQMRISSIETQRTMSSLTKRSMEFIGTGLSDSERIHKFNSFLSIPENSEAFSRVNDSALRAIERLKESIRLKEDLSAYVPLLDKLINASRRNLNAITSSGKTVLHLAAEHQECRSVEALLAKNVDIGKVGSSKETALLTAIKCGNEANAMAIIDYATRTGKGNLGNTKFIHRPNSKGETAFDLALEMGMPFVAVRCDPLRASQSNFFKLCKYGFFESYVDAWVKKNKPSAQILRRAYLEAAKGGSEALMTYFRFDLDLDYQIKDSNNCTVLHYAAQHDYFDPIDEAVFANRLELILQKDKSGKTLAAYASERGSLGALKILLPFFEKHKVSLFKQFKNSEDHLLVGAVQNSHLKAADAIICSMRTIKIAINSRKETAAHIAVKNDDVEMLNLLKERGIDFQARDINKQTVFHIALKRGHSDTLDYLLDPHNAIAVPRDVLGYAAAVSTPDVIEKFLSKEVSMEPLSTQLGPINNAAYHDNVSCLAVLKKHGADLNKKNARGLSPILIAAERGSLECMKFLLQQGVQVNVKNGSNQTPLHLAAYKGHDAIVELLLAYGASIGARNDQSLTPYEHASKRGNKGIVAIFTGDQKRFNALKSQLIAAVKNQEAETVLRLAGEIPHHHSMSFSFNGRIQNMTLAQVICSMEPCRLNKGKVLSAFLKKFPNSAKAKNTSGETLAHTLAKQGDYIKSNGVSLFEADINGRTPLHYLAQRSDPKTLTDILKQAGGNLNVEDSKGYTPAFNALIGENLDNLEVLLKAGCNVSHVNYSLFTLLSLAVANGNLKAAAMLLKYGANPNQLIHSTKKTVMHEAVRLGSLDMMELLVRHGLRYGHADIDGVSPILLAAGLGKLSMVKMLLGIGASLLEVDRHGRTIAHYAVLSQDIDTVLFLENEGVSYDVSSDKVEAPLRSSQFSISSGLTPAHYAASLGDADLIKVMDRANVGMKHKTDGGSSVSDYAAKSDNKELFKYLKPSGDLWNIDNQVANNKNAIHEALFHDNIDILRVILSEIEDINNPVDTKGRSMLHLAAECGAKKCTEELIALGAEMSSKDLSGNTLLHSAVLHGQIVYISYLLDNDYIDIDSKNGKGKTPLILACENQKTDIISLLMKYSASLDIQDKSGMKALEYSMMYKNIEAINSLLKSSSGVDGLNRAIAHAENSEVHSLVKSCNINQVNRSGLSPLHMAILCNNLHALRLLVANGADLEIKNSNRETPLVYASRVNPGIKNTLTSLGERH